MMGEYSESQRAAVRRLRWLSQYCGENKNVEVVDDVERAQAQIAEVVVDSVDRFLRRDGRPAATACLSQYSDCLLGITVPILPARPRIPCALT
jgi:hypothetical protein